MGFVYAGRGISSACQLTAANIDQRDTAYDILDNIFGLLLGNKEYIRPELKSDCKSQGIDWQTPLRCHMGDDRPKWFVKRIMRICRRVETTIRQLVKYFDIAHCGCRDMWHLTGRIDCKILACTVGASLNIQAGKEPAPFEGLISA